MSRTNETESQRAARWAGSIAQCHSILEQLSVEMVNLADGVSKRSVTAKVSGIWNPDQHTVLAVLRSGQGYILTLTASAFKDVAVGGEIQTQILDYVGLRWPPWVIHSSTTGQVSDEAYSRVWSEVKP